MLPDGHALRFFCDDWFRPVNLAIEALDGARPVAARQTKTGHPKVTRPHGKNGAAQRKPSSEV